MPAHGGFGMGLERWVSRLIGAADIREAVLFPRDLNRLTPWRVVLTMQYGELITRAFSIVWRHKYLWLLAILGGADVTSGGVGGGNFSGLGGSSGGGGGGGGGAGGAGGPAGVQDAANAVGQFVQDNLGLIVLFGVLALVVAIAWWLLSCVTTGALVRATAEHDAERPFGLGLAWRTGLGTFGRILGLRLLGLVWGVVVLGTIAGVVVFGVVGYVNGQNGAVALAATAGALLVAVLLLASIPVGIAFILGTRSVVLEQRGPLQALGRGFGLVRARLGRVLLVWLLQVGLALVAGIGVAIVLIPVVLVMAAVVVAAAVGGGGGAAVVVAIPLALVLIVVTVILGGVVGSYLSAYWTLAFRRLEIEAPRPVAWPQAPYGAG